MKEEFEKYLAANYPNTEINKPCSISEKVHIRFQLSGDEMFKLFRNGKEFKWYGDLGNDFDPEPMTAEEEEKHQKHIDNGDIKAKYRINKIISRTFQESDSDIWLLAYEYENQLFDPDEKNKEYLHSLISEDAHSKFHIETEPIHSGIYEVDENDNEIEDILDAKVIIGKIKQNQIELSKVLEGIINLERGKTPSIPQEFYLFDSKSSIGFHIYDDRGCLIWADNAETIRHLYEEFNDWIVEYHRQEIDKQFNSKTNK